MSVFFRASLPVLALAALTSSAQAQNAAPAAAQDHSAHDPAAAAPAETAPGARPPKAGGMMGGMMSNMMGGKGGGMPGCGMMQAPGKSGGMSGGMMAGKPAMGRPFEHVEGRIAFLKAELQIAEAQEPQWTAFAEALRINAAAHRLAHEQQSADGETLAAWPERLAARRKAMAARLDALTALETAAGPLYAVLSDAQKAQADKLLSGPMGVK